MKKALIVIGLVILACGICEIAMFESGYDNGASLLLPRYLVAFGIMGEIETAHPYLIFVTAFVPSVLFGIAIWLHMIGKNKEENKEK